jgi:hypothetical protein
MLHGFAPPGTPAPFTVYRNLWAGRQIADAAGVEGLFAARLYHSDGSGGAGARALAAFRLVYEAGAPRRDEPPPFEAGWMIYQWVQGARVEATGAAGAQVRAFTELRTTTGRRTMWLDAAPVRGDRSSLRLPYASGRNGTVTARAWRLVDAAHDAEVVLTEDDVLGGRRIEVDFGTGRISRR